MIPSENVAAKIKIAKLDTKMDVTNEGKTKDMDSSVDFGPIETDEKTDSLSGRDKPAETKHIYL